MENQQNSPALQDYQGSGAEFLKRVDYDAKTAEINKRLDVLEKRVKDNDAFAKAFTEAFDNSKKLDETLVAAVINLIKTNTQVKSAIKDSVKGIDREWQGMAVKRVGFAVWTLAVSIVSGAVVFFLTKH